MTVSIGRLISRDVGRDAVHVAIAPITAPTDLQPGQHVDQYGNPEAPGVVSVGIVDPFLRVPVLTGQRFWLFLYPNSVTAIRHEWSHPAFPTTSAPEVNQAIKEYLDQKKGRPSAPPTGNT
jgi:hypothetical protein